MRVEFKFAIEKNLKNLIYIEVAEDNPVYYSENGELYMKGGDHLVK